LEGGRRAWIYGIYVYVYVGTYRFIQTIYLLVREGVVLGENGGLVIIFKHSGGYELCLCVPEI